MTDSSRRLVICVAGLPDESRGASARLFYHYIERLKNADFKILNLLLLAPDQHTEQGVTRYAAKVAEPGRFEILPCWADKWIISGRASVKFNTAPLDSVLPQAEKFRPDVVFCLGDLQAAWVGGKITARSKVACLGDLNFQTWWYHAWYAAKENPKRAVALPSAWIRCVIWKNIYKHVLRRMDSVIVWSKSSERHLKRLGVESTYQPYPWPDTRDAAKASQVNRYPIPSFLFYGTLTALGSRSAFHFMVEKLYRRLVRLWHNSGFQIFIAGAEQLPAWVKKDIANKPEFKYLGFVDDLDELFASCHAVIAPIDTPIGNRSRIVTAMAKGALVVAHKNTSLGNPDLRDGETCYLADNPDEFVDRMQLAFDRPAQVETIITNARRCYERGFRPDVATERLVEELLRIMERKGTTFEVDKQREYVRGVDGK